MENGRRRISWSDLHLELLRSIATSFKNNSNDIRNFRAVCKNWRRSTSISVLLPFCEYSTPSYNLFTSSVLLLRPRGSSSSLTPWMVTIVEITKGNIQLCHPFFQTPFSNLPDNLDIAQFHPILLTESYHIASSSDCNISSALSGMEKVLVFSTRSLPRINDCSLLVLHSGRLGGYPSFECEDDKAQWVDVSYRGVDDFDDIVSFKGVIYAVDWEGKLYQMATNKVAVQKTLVPIAVSDAGAYKGWRKRLVGSLSDQKLYLIVRNQKNMFKVFMLSKHGKIWIWVKVQSFDDINQVLFLSSVYGYFVDTRSFPGRQLHNCIVFSDNAFPIYSFRGWVSPVDVKAEEEIWIFQLGVHDNEHSTFRPISCYPNFPFKLWSPPSWVLPAHIPSFQLHSDHRHSEGKEMHLDHEQAAVIPPPNSAETESSVDPVVRTDSVALHVVRTDSAAGHVVQTVAPHVIQPAVNKVSTLKFQGVDIHSEHLPILEKVWMKHGDVVKESKIRSCDFIATALASLAKLIVILETNSGKTLTDNQAHYLTSTLSDLQSMCVKVDWLVPFVEKALAWHKRKSLEAALKELEKAKAKVEELNRKFLEDMAKMKQGFDSNKKQIVSKRMSACISIDPDECLGEGLF